MAIWTNSRTFKFKDASTNVDNISDPLVFGSKFSNINDTEYSWSFGDGNTANGLGAVSRNPIHTYAQSGSYTVALTVKNNYGAQSDVETKSNQMLLRVDGNDKVSNSFDYRKVDFDSYDERISNRA